MLNVVKRIVVGADLGETLPDVLEEAGLLARTFGAELTLVHAIPEAPEGSPDYDAVTGEAERLLEEVRERQRAAGVQVSPAFRIGSQETHVLLQSVAADLSADLVVLAAGKRSTLERALLGTTAEKVVSHSPRPVWVVHPGRPRADLRRLLCAIDASEPAREALATATFLARTFVAELALLSVVPAGSEITGDPLAALTRDMDLHGIALTRLLREGRADERIVEAAEEVNPDLLILGTAGRTGLSRWFRGKNTAEKVLRKLPCSLLAIPAAKR
jgi:nucleotide-binding universal stress UspA family protein